MGSLSLFHWVILLAVVLLVFGAGRLPVVMGDFAKGIKAFKKGMRDEDEGIPPQTPGSEPPGQKIPPAPEPVRTVTPGDDKLN